MKDALKKISSINTAPFLRNFFLYLLVISFFVATLYVLITSPA